MPSTSTFSRALADFSENKLLEQVHEILIKENFEGEFAFHHSVKSSAIETREKPEYKAKEDKKHEL